MNKPLVIFLAIIAAYIVVADVDLGEPAYCNGVPTQHC